MRGQCPRDGTWDVVQGTKKTPTGRSGESDEAFETRLEAYKHLNDFAMGQILTHVNEGPSIWVRDKDAAYDMWEELKRFYMSKEYGTRQFVSFDT